MSFNLPSVGAMTRLYQAIPANTAVSVEVLPRHHSRHILTVFLDG
jgi:hypothetical protein